MRLVDFASLVSLRSTITISALLVISAPVPRACALSPAQKPAPAAKQVVPVKAQQESAKLRALVSEGKLYQARAEATRLLSERPNDADLQMEYGSILRASGQMKLALEHYQRAAAIDPHLGAAYVAISQLQLDNLDVPSALASAQKAKTLSPNDLDARLAYVSALIAADRVNDAEKELQSMINTGSANPAVLHLAYEVKVRKGDFESARRYLDTAIALSQQSTSWQIELADLEQRLNHPERARQVLRTILAQTPSATEARLRLARNLELFGDDFDAAISEYRTLLQYEPDSATALTGIERCRAKKNNVALRIKTGLRGLAAEIGKFFAQLSRRN
jgi:tetratricopeptide (TPR) repeat protein